jgi:NADH-quinone oxidoreductase subunit J
MNIEAIVFYFFAAVLLIAALRVITARNPVHAALFLVLAFFTAAAIWMLLRAEFLAIVLVLGGKYFGTEHLPNPGDPGAAYSNTKELGRLLYTDYVYPFELAAVILLVAIVAAIALTLRGRKDSKHQDPAKQVAVKRGDRVRLVSMPSEKKES